MSDELMGMNANRDGPLTEVPATLDEWKKKAEALWMILDDIDTYSDMFKPEQTPYYKAVNNKARQRFKQMESDGYFIVNTGRVKQ